MVLASGQPCVTPRLGTDRVSVGPTIQSAFKNHLLIISGAQGRELWSLAVSQVKDNTMKMMSYGVELFLAFCMK